MYSCLEESMDRGAWRASVYRVAESDTTERRTHTYTSFPFTGLTVMTLIDHQRAVYLSTQVLSAVRASLLETGLTAEMCGEPRFRVQGSLGRLLGGGVQR